MNPKIYKYQKLEYQGKTIFGKIVMGNFYRMEKFFQENEACFMFIEDGAIAIRTPENLIQLSSGDGLFAKCGNYFFEQNRPDENKTTTLIAAYFYPEIVSKLFSKDEILASDYNTNYDAKKVVINRLLSNFKSNINILLDNPEIVDEPLLLTKLKEFLILLAKIHQAPSTTDFVASFFKPYEYNFKKIVEQNLMSNLSLEQLSILCGMSLANFKRKFSEYYMESPKQYILRRKLEISQQLLQIRENRITDIAYDCGFDSPTTFNRNFKQRFGISPSDYRKKIALS